MTTISQVSITLVDLAPKVKRVDAIQSFISQETPIVTITDSDGATGTGYSYTIGTGGVVARIGCQVLTQAFATTTDMLNAA